MVERKEVSLFNQNAFREAIVNAFVHNLWVDGNAPMITVYSDRIEILSRRTLANIAYLREHGFIERIGSKKNGYWQV